MGVLWHGGPVPCLGVFHMCGLHPVNASHAPHRCDKQKWLLRILKGPLGTSSPEEPLRLILPVVMTVCQCHAKVACVPSVRLPRHLRRCVFTARSDVGKGDDPERGAVPCWPPRSRGRRDGSPDPSEAKVLTPLLIPEPLRASVGSSAKWGENDYPSLHLISCFS